MITINHISVRNFMSIKELELDFDPNMIMAITGFNGSGKSSLLYAIATCISGFRKGETYRDYVKLGEDYATIQLDATLSDKPIHYDIQIAADGVSGTPMKRTVIYDGSEYHNSDYAQFIKEHDLGFIEGLMFSFQGANNIIEARPADRANALRKLFKYDFSDIVESFKEKHEGYKTSSIKINALLDELRSKTFPKQSLMRETLPKVIEGWESRLSEVNESLSKLNDINKDSLDKCIRELASTNRKITDTISKNKKDTDAIDTSKASIDKCKAIIANEDAYRKELDDITSEIQLHKKEYEENKAKHTELTSQINIKKYAIEELEKQIAISKTGVCHACGQPIEQSHLDKLNESLANELKEKTALEDSVRELGFDVRDIKGKELDKKSREIQSELQKIETSKASLTQNENRITELTNMISERLEHLKTLETQKSSLEKEKEKLDSLSETFAQKDALVEERDSLKAKIQNARDNSVKNAERKRANLKVEAQEKERDERVAELSSKSNEIMIQLSDAKTCIDVFENLFPNYLVLQAAQILEDYINEIIHRVFPNMRVKLSQQRSGVNFYYRVDDETDDWLAISMASGAQKQILTLAYSISLARMYGLKCILLDEVDASLSAENAEIVYNFIASLDNFEQIVFISHRKESIEAAREVNPRTVCYTVEDGEYTPLD